MFAWNKKMLRFINPGCNEMYKYKYTAENIQALTHCEHVQTYIHCEPYI